MHLPISLLCLLLGRFCLLPTSVGPVEDPVSRAMRMQRGSQKLQCLVLGHGRIVGFEEQQRVAHFYIVALFHPNLDHSSALLRSNGVLQHLDLTLHRPLSGPKREADGNAASRQSRCNGHCRHRFPCRMSAFRLHSCGLFVCRSPSFHGFASLGKRALFVTKKLCLLRLCRGGQAKIPYLYIPTDYLNVKLLEPIMLPSTKILT